jgi:lysozyme family protein
LNTFDDCLKPLLVHEGGNDDDPQDPGGRTSRGITQSEYDRYRIQHGLAPQDVWSAADSEVRWIYLFNYWNMMKCDQLPAGVDYCVFDYGVNSGISRAAKILQKVLGVPVDGVIGPATITNVTAHRTPISVINAVCDERLAFLRALKTWPHFGTGWGRRVEEVRATSLRMASQAPKPAPAKPSNNPLVAIFNAVMAIFQRKQT